MTGTERRNVRQRAEQRGRWAEYAAEAMFRVKGYAILGRRVRTPMGEIDLIAARGDTVAFAEVKARVDRSVALSAVTPHQARRIVNAARYWISRNRPAANRNCRFDIVTVNPYLWPRHLANAFGEDLW